MNTVLYRNNLNSPVTLDISPVEIKYSTEKKPIEKFSPDDKSKWILSRFINTERNSRLNSGLPSDKLWELKWKTPLNNEAIPWTLLLKDDRILIQNESGWQLFETSGKIILNGTRGEGDITIDPALPIFYFNDPSGFVTAADLQTGKEKFLFYPYLGSAYDRTILYSEGNKIISAGKELPVMTHDSPVKAPELTILELLDLGTSRKTDEDGILDSTFQIENLICKSTRVAFANSGSNIIIAVPNHIYFIDGNLQIVKVLVSKFVPLEISLDEEMRIYLLAEIEIDENTKQTEVWIIESDGTLISKVKVESIPNNYLTPPVIDDEHTVYIRYENKIIAIDLSGNNLWEQYIQKPLAGLTAAKDYLLTAEGTLLTAFDSKGERRFIYQFEEELSTSALIVDDQIFVASRTHLYCLIPKK